jgi:ABC-type nitrate/sulfonate/bicarbonate transport system permease component
MEKTITEKVKEIKKASILKRISSIILIPLLIMWFISGQITENTDYLYGWLFASITLTTLFSITNFQPLKECDV